MTAASPASTRCLVCAAQATGFHFEAQSCSACAAFFRRTVALTKTFTCITGRDDCNVHYSMHQICRSCRHKKCLSSGMKPAGVQPKKGAVETGRAFFTKSGLKRNKKFATISPMTAEEKEAAVARKVPKIEVVSDWQEDAGFDEEMDEKSPAFRKTSIPTSSRSTATSTSTTPRPSPIGSSYSEKPTVSSTSTNTKYYDVLEMFMREEMKLGERRRLLYSEGAVGTLLGQNKQCPYKRDDIKPLVFHDFRLTIKTHIMLVYEWLQSWPELQELDDFDRMSMLRKCVLIHFLLDPSFLSYQIGESDKLIMQNGGFISTADHLNGVGWEDEEDISGENKRKYYVPMMKHITDEIMPAMQAMDITFEEFVALKALASFQGAFENVSEPKRGLVTQTVNRLMMALHSHYSKNSIPDLPERFGSIVLMLSNIFTAGNEFVKNHREIDIFHIWDLDKLVLELLNLDKIMETEARATAEKRAIRNGINVINNNNINNGSDS